MNDDSFVRYECSGCGVPIKSSKSIAEAGVECPKCGVKFVPEKYLPPKSPKATLSYHVEQTAKRFIIAAGACLVAMCISFFVALVNSESSADVLVWCIVAGGCLSLAGFFYLIAQIVHIRAELVRNRPTK